MSVNKVRLIHTQKILYKEEQKWKRNSKKVLPWSNGKLETVENPEVKDQTSTDITINGVKLKIDGLTVNKDETETPVKYKTWTAKGTVVLDGKLDESTGILKGKVVLLTKATTTNRNNTN